MLAPDAALDFWQQGYAARNDGKNIADNPYRATRPLAAEEWDQGWYEWQKDNGQFGVGA